MKAEPSDFCSGNTYKNVIMTFNGDRFVVRLSLCLRFGCILLISFRNMTKTVKSAVRQILFTMISKYKQKQDQQIALLKQKEEYLQVAIEFIG